MVSKTCIATEAARAEKMRKATLLNAITVALGKANGIFGEQARGDESPRVCSYVHYSGNSRPPRAPGASRDFA